MSSEKLTLFCLPSPVSILHKSIAGRYRPVRVADGPITDRCRFIKNASWELITQVDLCKSGYSVRCSVSYGERIIFQGAGHLGKRSTLKGKILSPRGAIYLLYSILLSRQKYLTQSFASYERVSFAVIFIVVNG